MSSPPPHPAPPAELHPVHPAPAPTTHAAQSHAAQALPPGPAAPRIGRAGNLLYVSATLLASAWAMVLLFVVYPRQPVDAGYTDDDAPVVSPEGNVTTVKRWQVEEAVKSHGYLSPSEEQVRLFDEQRAQTLRDVRRDKLIWFLVAAAFPGAGLLLLRVWFLWKSRS
jgi:hypothetical protein